jgi:type I site-specific restriction endonuclease
MASAAAAAAGEQAAAGLPGSSSNARVTSGSGSTSNNGAAAAAVAAAAAISCEDDEGDIVDEDMFDGRDMNEDVMNNAAAEWLDAAVAEKLATPCPTNHKAAAAAAAGRVPAPLQQLAAADVVVANIQQLSQGKLEALFPRTYFDVVIMDEAHHAAARTWGGVLEYFAASSKVKPLMVLHSV